MLGHLPLLHAWGHEALRCLSLSPQRGRLVLLLLWLLLLGMRHGSHTHTC